MLSSEELGKILGSKLPSFITNDIHWRSQDSTAESILFYRLGDDEKSHGLFLERLKETKFSWLIVNKEVSGLPSSSTVLDESQWPRVQYEILNHLFPLPNIKFLGVTGTNGKTTTADLVLQLGHLMGFKGLSIGTLGVREYNKTLLDFGLTTPSLIDMRKFLNLYGSNKDFCVMEASSHALVQERLYGINFDSAGWLSFSQDHLDYHKTMEDYFQAKAIIFDKLKPKAKLFVPSEQKELFQKTFSLSSKVEAAPEISESLPLFFQTQFNKNNLEVALAMITSIFSFVGSLDYKKVTSPDGRFYIQEVDSNFIVVDFAHTPDALENICKGIRKTFPDYKLKVLFGCGGDRDRSKRPLMAQVVSKWADEIYVTSDNPRSENPDQIIADILTGIEGKKVSSITERPKAVKTAFSELKNKEVLLLAGKGHEDYILINGVKHPYSDIREVDEYIARKAK